jgi:pimeloyl-ACP methyl ester carboxylesterase
MTHTLGLRSGRRLEVQEYGDPAGHPAIFFHGLIGSHHQASYIDEQAKQAGLRLIAPNRPGVGGSDFARRKTPLEAVPDVEDLAAALNLSEFSVIGISGGTPYALATLYRLGRQVSTATIISGMGPSALPGALRGMDRRRRWFMGLGARLPRLARSAFEKVSERYKLDPERFLHRLVATWSAPDRAIFQRRPIFELFLKDLHAVFTAGVGPEGLAQELVLYRNYGFSLRELPRDRPITLWHGLADTIVPPAMTWVLTQQLPSCEAHFVPGGHFVAVDCADAIIARMMQQLQRQDQPREALP